MPDLYWLDGILDQDELRQARIAADRILIEEALSVVAESQVDQPIVDGFASEALDLLAWDALNVERRSPAARQLCSQAFSLARGQIQAPSNDDDLSTMLRAVCLGWLADEPTLATRLLNDLEITDVGAEQPWPIQVEGAVTRLWLLLLRKRGWADLERIGSILTEMRRRQEDAEATYFRGSPDEPQADAWGLASNYHLLRTAEILAQYLTTGGVSEGEPDLRFDPRAALQSQFDRAITAAQHAGAVAIEERCRLLGFVADQIVDNSLWSIIRGVSPVTRRFVQSLVDRNVAKPLFELLPPQRVALAEQGLARSGQRSVVVSMPTSSGKTLIAQFRILQALNAFEAVSGWVAYVAPTRALVNQIARRLRRDFEPLGIHVEKVSPALEVDGLEADIMLEQNADQQFRVLVATPEKLDMLLRGGWQEQVARPLCLVVVDEAHNLGEGARGLRLELLLATINREAEDAAYLLLTPFVPNASEVAAWLDPQSNQAVQLSLDWTPNDRIIALAERVRGERRGDYGIGLNTLVTSRETLATDQVMPIGPNRPLDQSWSQAGSPGALAAATASVVSARGGTITLAQRPDHAWGLARQIAAKASSDYTSEDLRTARLFISHEYGTDFALADLVSRRVGVHHSGVSDEVRGLMEHLLESGDLLHLVATTTVAQGVNFPVANVVLASHQFPYGVDMPPSDFWNLAGRAGRVDQGQVGLIVLSAPDEQKAAKLRTFVGRQVSALNSTLMSMVLEALAASEELDLAALAYKDTWSAFVQYLAHTYRQIGDADRFAAEVEQVLRGTFGFQDLRAQQPASASALIRSVREYAVGLAGKPVSLVDSTGFAWESVNATLGRLADASISDQIWESPLFDGDRKPLADLVGVMLRVPELRENLVEINEEHGEGAGDFVARVMSDWVNGRNLHDLALDYFKRSNDDDLAAMTRCCSRLFGSIAPTVAWGLSAMQALTLRGVYDELPPERQRELQNLPSFAFYGVNSESSVALRLLGVPRTAAKQIAAGLGLPATGKLTESVGTVRSRLQKFDNDSWQAVLGDTGPAYRRVWQILNGT